MAEFGVVGGAGQAAMRFGYYAGNTARDASIGPGYFTVVVSTGVHADNIKDFCAMISIGNNGVILTELDKEMYFSATISSVFYHFKAKVSNHTTSNTALMLLISSNDSQGSRQDVSGVIGFNRK